MYVPSGTPVSVQDVAVSNTVLLVPQAAVVVAPCFRMRKYPVGAGTPAEAVQLTATLDMLDPATVTPVGAPSVEVVPCPVPDPTERQYGAAAGATTTIAARAAVTKAVTRRFRRRQHRCLTADLQSQVSTALTGDAGCPQGVKAGG